MRDAPRHKFHNWLMEAQDREKDWRKNNEVNFNYYDNDQFDEETQLELEERGQPATVLNIVRPMVDMVLALEVQKRVDMRVIPREEDDSEMADVLTKLLVYVQDQNDCNFYLAQTFREGIIGGRGWTMVDVEEDELGENQIVVKWIPWEEVFIDPFHRKPDGSDARYIIRQVWMDRDVVKEMWPDKAEDIETAFNDDYEGIEWEAQQSSGGSFGYYDSKSRRVRLCYCWYKSAKGEIKFCIFADEVFLVGSEDGENKDPNGINMYPLIPFYAFREHTGNPKGLVEYLRDPQDLINKLNSKYVWNLASNRVMIEEGATDDIDEFTDQWRRPDGVAILNNGAINKSKVKTEDNLRECQYLVNHMQFIYGMAQRTSGVNDSMLGVGGVNERSAQQQNQRIVSGSTMQTRLMENFHFTNKRQAQVILRMIGKYYDQPRTVRITQPNGKHEFIKINQANDMAQDGTISRINQIGDVLRYDVFLKPVAPFDALREIQMRLFAEVAKAGTFPPHIASKILLQSSDLPGKAEILKEVEDFYKTQLPPEQ